MKGRVLIVNIYFSPHSFGGATVVAEQCAQRLVSQHDWAVTAFTSTERPSLPDYALRRYRTMGIDVAAINLPKHLPAKLRVDNPLTNARFTDVLDSFQPDVVHMHAIQNLGAGIIDAVCVRNIPLVITMHDCWWICDRQFMLDNTGHYCFQRRISPDICRFCVDDFKASEIKLNYLATQMNKADMLLFPSEFLRDLYIANGANAAHSLVNKNGVIQPTRKRQRETRGNEACVFGFLGGPGPMKGSDQICLAIQALNDPALRLKVVDAAQNVGQTWQIGDYWNLPADIQHIPAFSQDSLDKFYDSIDVLLFPSQVKESFGLSVREALLRDVWVISTDAGGASEEIRHGVNGTIIPLDGTSDPLAMAMKDCMRRTDWNDFRNPFKSDITTADQQAQELSAIFTSLTNRTRHSQ